MGGSTVMKFELPSQGFFEILHSTTHGHFSSIASEHEIKSNPALSRYPPVVTATQNHPTDVATPSV